MPRYLTLATPLAGVALAFATALPLSAQRATTTPGVLVSQQICAMGAIDDLNQMVAEVWAPVLDAAVTDGRLTGWGVLNHHWGDEWNWLIYYSATDAETLIPTVSDLLGEIIQTMPGDPIEQFGEWCSAHKDNLYTQPIMQGVQPPLPGGS